MDHSARRIHLDHSRLSQMREPVQRHDDLLAVPEVLLGPVLAAVNSMDRASETVRHTVPFTVAIPNAAKRLNPANLLSHLR